jgi:hypothetical protein
MQKEALGILTILGKQAFQVYGYRRLAVFIVRFMPLWVGSCCHNQRGTLGKVHNTSTLHKTKSCAARTSKTKATIASKNIGARATVP